MEARPRHPLRRTLARASALAVCALAAGCGSELEERVDRYRAAVERAVGARAAPPSATPSETAPPRRRLVLLDVSSPTMGMRDFLSLQGCRLAELAGYRNSPMGRVMPPTRRLLYEVEVLEAGRACLSEAESERGARFAGMLAEKRADLPRHVWNALWTTEEVEGLLAATQAPLARASLADAASPLREVAGLLDAGVESTDEAARLEDALARLRGVEPLGLALQRLDAISRGLESVAALVAGRGEGRCEPVEGRLAAAFREGYLQGVQPDMARLDRGVAPVLEALATLYARSSADLPLDASVRRYHERVLSPTEPDAVWTRYRTALRTHAAAWEPTLRACGVLPSA